LVIMDIAGSNYFRDEKCLCILKHKIDELFSFLKIITVIWP
jgi:hypothetical protein